MQQLTPLPPIDYLVIGHLTCDQTPDGLRLGGTAAYAALTARSLGLRVGIVTAWGAELPLGPLETIPLVSFPTDQSTTFENKPGPEGRQQFVYHVAPPIHFNLVPDAWKNAPIVHLGPVAQEVDPALVRHFPTALLGVTPQGWLRSWDDQGVIHPTEWPESAFVLQRAGAAVISSEDVGFDEIIIEEMATQCRVFAVTEAQNGVRLYWNGDVRRFRPPETQFIDDTGAGDIFAAAFFTRLYTGRPPASPPYCLHYPLPGQELPEFPLRRKLRPA